MVVMNGRRLALHNLCCDAWQRGMIEYLFVLGNAPPVAKILKETTGIIKRTGNGGKLARLREIDFDAAPQCLAAQVFLDGSV